VHPRVGLEVLVERELNCGSLLTGLSKPTSVSCVHLKPRSNNPGAGSSRFGSRACMSRYETQSVDVVE
jgi:hypothetical protein